MEFVYTSIVCLNLVVDMYPYLKNNQFYRYDKMWRVFENITVSIDLTNLFLRCEIKVSNVAIGIVV